jgi:hypothetical protein
VDHVGVSDEVKRNKDGSHRFYRGFFYKSGSTSEGHAKKVSNQLNAYGIKHDVVDHGTQDYKPFKGGASVKTQNHHWVDIKIHPGQKIDLDESVELEDLEEVSKDAANALKDSAAKAMSNLKGQGRKELYAKNVRRFDLASDKLSGKARVPANEETEELDEISAGMAQSYLQKKRERDYNTSSDGTTHTLKKPTTLNRLNKDIKGTVRALRTIEKTKNEEVEVELTQDEIDNIEAILSDLDEERLDEIGTTWQPTSKRVKAAREAAYRKKIGEEEYAKRQKAKAEKKAAYSADLKKKREERYKQERLAKKQASANPDPEKPKNKSFFNTIKSKLGLGEEINHEDLIEALLADLDEGRGRPPKEGSDAWKRRQTQAAEDVPALGIQLRKAASINKPVTFANGESKQIHPDHINRFNDHMDARKTSQQKAEFQKTANKSHADFVKVVTADIPHRAKDTGEIVKYGK